ncbi:MAG: methionine gamma-lyase family protein [Lachnospiraceae bacterium]|nr:methionine gamma-lyase family protein [Lachnospiraceae bacterium]
MNHNETDSLFPASFGITDDVLRFSEDCLQELADTFSKIDRTAEYNTYRVMESFQRAHVSEAHLKGTTGYGYDDIGRDTLEKVYAGYFRTEDALVRPQIVSGTHALTLALRGNLRPNDTLLSVSGKPYDTLEEVIGIRPSRGSLQECGIRYKEVSLLPDSSFDEEKILQALDDPSIRLAAIQRSRGYQTRKSLSVAKIGEVIALIKEKRPDVLVLVDNCYGEFIDRKEPSEVGADMVVGSLIKNPGGGLAPTGGYIAGTAECIANAAVFLTSPGLGKEVGASLQVLPALYQGFFMGPVVSAAALKGAVFAARAFEKLGFPVFPSSGEPRADIIQAVTLHDPDKLIAFCQGIQSASPVDSFVSAEPAPMPGYDSDVIMAAGAFVSGSSIELSADGPMREPYNVFFQGGLSFPHAKYGIMKAIQNLLDRHLISL